MRIFGHELIWRKIPPEEPFEISVKYPDKFPNIPTATHRFVTIQAKEGFIIRGIYKGLWRVVDNPAILIVIEDN